MSDASPPTTNPAITEAVIPALKAGTAAGIGGFLIGGGVGTLRSAHPGLVATFTAAQFFVLGSSFYWTREVLLNGTSSIRTKNREKVSSTVAGAVSGAAAGRFYGRVNSVAGACFVGTLAFLGQSYVHRTAERTSIPRDPRPAWERLLDSKWIPFKNISNHDYEVMLNEKLIKVEAEISMVDEKIRVLREVEDGNLAKLPDHKP